MTSFASGPKSRRDAACALPPDALQEAKIKPLENVGIFSGARPGTTRAPRQNPFAQPSLLFLCPSGQSFRITLGKKKKPLYAVGLSSSRTARGATSARRNIRLFSLKRCAFQTSNFPSVFGRTLVLWQLRLPIPRGAGILGSLAAMTPLDAHSREAAPRCRHCPRPFFSESEALKKIFFTKSTFEGRLPARVVRHTSPQETTQRRTTRDTTASRSLHAKELTRPRRARHEISL